MAPAHIRKMFVSLLTHKSLNSISLLSKYSLCLYCLFFGSLFATFSQAGSNSVTLKEQLLQKKLPQHNKRSSSLLSVQSSKRYIVKYLDGMRPAVQSNVPGAAQVRQLKVLKNLEILDIPNDINIQRTLNSYKNRADVEYIEEDSVVTILATPNDTDFNRLWSMHNIGQTSGLSDADINAVEAWDVTTGSSDIVVAIIDTGIDYRHSDLQNNMWVNPNEIANDGIDNDNNGYIDDIFGIDAVNNDGDPMDGNNHGTHVAGTIGAQGNNSQGVVGVNWNIKMIACKFLDDYGSGFTSDAIECLDYLLDLKQNHNVNLIASNNSWGGGGFSQALLDAIEQQREAGILFIAAAGNSSNNNDINLSYPSSYDSSNIIAVASTNRLDELSYFSSYGASTVDVAAPGSEIYSTVAGGGYDTFSGTSMAAPHVTGLIALLAAQQPSLAITQLKKIILWSGTPLDALNNKVLSGRRIRAWDDNGSGALTCASQGEGLVVSPATILANQSHSIALGDNQSVLLSYTVNGCLGAADEIEVSLSDSTVITLRDDGLNGDKAASDGILSANYTYSGASPLVLTFPNNSVLNISPISTYRAAEIQSWSWENINGTRLSIGDDATNTLTSPFDITFAEVDVGNKLYVSNNGVIIFQDNYVSFSNSQLPTTFLPPMGISPFWDDLLVINTNNNQGVFYETTGISPNRKLVIEWRDINHYWSTDDTITFQVVFKEGNSDIQVNYKDMVFSDPYLDYGNSATVGIQQSHELAHQFSFNAAELHNNLSLLWSVGDALPKPVINQVDISGELFVDTELTFSISATPVENTSITSYQIDFTDDGTFDYSGSDRTTSHSYSGFGQFTYRVKVTDSNNQIATYLANITIADLTIEQKIQRAIEIREAEIVANPSSLGLFDLEQRNEFANLSVAERDQQIISNPEILGLYANLKVIDSARIAALESGWHMIANPQLIEDLSVFDNVILITWYSHTDDMYFVYSADDSIVQEMFQAGVAIASRVPAGAGLWVKK